MHVASDAVQQQDAIQESLERLLSKIPETDGGREMVRQAFDVADRLHVSQVRKSGELYIEHPLAVAHLLCDLRLDPASIAAGLLHDVLEDTPMTLDELRSMFPEPIPALVEGVTKISRIHFDTSREHQIENLRKIIVAMAKDIRVLMVKLCDRLHNMRTLRPLNSDRRLAISRETLDIYAPLANRLGMVRIKSELEDLSMYYLYPEEYQEITRYIARKKRERENVIQNSIEYLHNYLGELGHTNIEIKGRPKHFYSIHRKMARDRLTLEEIYDLNALRVLCDTESQCYEILGQIHAIWQPKPGRFKDYIGMPKPNLYQSIHTTVVGYEGIMTEIQIRTRQMDQVAEFGIAAHWKYKEGRIDQFEDKRLDWLRQVSEWIQDPGDPNSMLDLLKKDVFADTALCFTPKGDVIELPADATPIDFAFAIHTQVGFHCTGARVNRRMVTLRTPLQHGDEVEILTSKAGHPSRDWLDIVQTGRARSKIKHWLKSKQMETWVADGRAALMKLLKERNIEVSKAELDQHLDELLKPYRLRTIDDLLAEIGFGTISAQAALTRMNPDWSKARRPPRKTKKGTTGSKALIHVEGVEGIQVRIANCCKPIQGDPIVGFVTRGRGISIHHADCPSITRLTSHIEESERILPAHWNNDEPASHLVWMRIEAVDRTGLLAEISSILSARNISIQCCNTRSDKRKGTAVMRYEVEVTDIREVVGVLAALRETKGVITAERVSRATS